MSTYHTSLITRLFLWEYDNVLLFIHQAFYLPLKQISADVPSNSAGHMQNKYKIVCHGSERTVKYKTLNNNQLNEDSKDHLCVLSFYRSENHPMFNPFHHFIYSLYFDIIHSFWHCKGRSQHVASQIRT